MDQDQFEGKVSMWHDEKHCGFHETINVERDGERVIGSKP